LVRRSIAPGAGGADAELAPLAGDDAPVSVLSGADALNVACCLLIRCAAGAGSKRDELKARHKIHDFNGKPLAPTRHVDDALGLGRRE
jgi:hypothetical protein